MMQKRRALWGLLLVAGPVLASADNGLDGWIPQGWKQVAQATGDLTQDGVDEQLLVLEQTDSSKFKTNDSLGAPLLNLNPRRLLILAKGAGGYQPLLSRDDLLPSEHDADSPCLADPLLEQGGIAIRGGKLIISLGFWVSCGSYSVSSEHFTFRWHDSRLRLIGYDYQQFSRSSGEITEQSVNYLTAKQKVVTGKNEFEPSTAKESWYKLPAMPAFYLDEIALICHQDKAPACGWAPPLP